MNRPSISERINRHNNQNNERKSLEYKRINDQIEQRRREEKEKEQSRRKLLDMLWDAADAVQILERFRIELAPKTREEEWDERFVVALRYLPQLTYLRDCLYDEVYHMD